MSRVVFVNRYFFPDNSATAQLLGDLAFALAARGHEVSVITSRQLYENPGALLPQTEAIAGVAVHRLRTSRFGRAARFGRVLDYASFYAAAWLRLRRVARPGDIVVAKTDPPLLGVVAMLAASRLGVRLVNWIQDLYPEVAMRLGVPLIRGPAGNALLRLRDSSLRRAAANVAVGEGMAALVRSRRVAADRVHVIPNWCDDERIRPLAPTDNPLIERWGLADRFVVGYCGNLGQAHEYETLLGAAARLRTRRNILFLFVGGGTKYAELAARVKAEGLAGSFRFMPYQDWQVLPQSLAVPQLHWLSLKPELEGLIVPSKFYGIAAAGRPIVAVTACDGEIARLVQRYRCGIAVEPGDAAGLAAAIAQLSDAPGRLAAMGRAARGMVEERFARRDAIERWSCLMAALGAGLITSPTETALPTGRAPRMTANPS